MSTSGEKPGPTFDMPRVDDPVAPVVGDEAFAQPPENAAATPEPIARDSRSHGTIAPLVARSGVARLAGARSEPGPAPDGGRALAIGIAGGMGRVLAWLLAVPAAFLPAAWRRPLDRLSPPWTSAVVASGILEVMIAGIAWARAFMSFSEALVAEAGAVAAGVMNGDHGDGGDAYRVAQVQGFAIWLLFLFTPAALVLGYFIVEGVLRAVGGAVTGEVRGSLPLWILERGLARAWAAIERARRDPGPPDEVVHPAAGADGNLQVASFHRKDWDILVTVELAGKRYRLADTREDPGAQRRFVYTLRPAADHEIVRRVHRYDPADPAAPG